ncbi:MAG TPA: multicopper oxidase domain-containing protein, partial [Actinomycetota bacterium]|nr:multicopper oxidase domain-containing protein [Actinomycetota bacterium]
MGRRHWMVIVSALLVVMLVASACSGDDGSEGEGSAARAESIDVSLSEFVIAPGMIHAPAGESLTFNVANDGAAAHTFAVETGSDVLATAELQPGDTATLEVPPLEPGEFRTLCTVSGHEGAGMVGSLMVASGDNAAGASGAAGHSGATGQSGATGGVGAHAQMTVEEMLSGHEESVAAFPAETERAGNELLDARIEGGSKTFELTAEEVRWETKPGVFVDAMGFNGTVPGPELRVNVGDHVRIVVTNEMSQPTTLHLHGVTVPNGMDGVPFITQDPIMPGGFFTYEFDVVDPPGMYVYHSHFNSTEQVGKGLYGAFIVEPKRNDWSSLYGEPVDVESTLFLGDGPTGFVLNGKEFPATQPIAAEVGDGVLIHLANDGAQIHPMHLHGYHFQVVAEDGFVLDPGQRYMADTLMVAPGQRFDVLVRADYPGVWAYHCHILP